MSGDILACPDLAGTGDATDMEWVEARDAAEPLHFTGQPPHNKEGIILAQSINSVEVMKPL